MSDPKDDSAASESAQGTPAQETPAEENPWYVLATIAGEQSGDEIDWDLSAMNRFYWNAWAAQDLSDAEKAEIKNARGQPVLADTPAWSRVKAEVEAEFAKRLPGASLPKPVHQVNFAQVTFSKPVSFAGFYFPASAYFDYATFSGDADFFDATFSGEAVFESATFSGDADFRSATFSGEAVFPSATFSGDARFVRATFSGEAVFFDATFSGDADFTRAKFSGDAGFDDATFSGDAYFARATFSGPTKFIQTMFLKRARFTDASFDAPCNFREAEFKTAYPDLEGTLLHAKTNITAEDVFWPPRGKQKPADEQNDEPQTDKEVAQSCAHLRQNMAAQGLPDAAHFFFRREMTHRARIAWWWERPLYALYRAVEYGYGVWQPIIGLLATWVLGGLALWYWGALVGRVAFGLSLSNIFRIFGFQRVYFEPGLIKSLPFWLEVMTGAQTALGFVLLFLLGLGLRNRFRMR